VKVHRNSGIAATLFVVALALTAAGCGGDGLYGPNSARMRLLLSGDAAAAAPAPSADGSVLGHDGGEGDGRPSWWFQSANVTLSSILVRNLNGVLVPLAIPLPITIDVVQIEGGRQIPLPDALLPPGIYDQVVVVMTAVQGLTHDGTVITVQPPGGGWTAVIPICPLPIAEGSTATVGIQLMVRHSFLRHGGHFAFQPRFKSHLDCGDDDDDDVDG
jgi:hypothetical protein